MTKIKDAHYYGSQTYVDRIMSDVKFLARPYKRIDDNHLVVFALPPKRKKEDKDDGRKQKKVSR